jgi:hypothetical protein
MLENPICAVNRMSRCYWLDTGGRLRPNHVKRTDLGREPPFLTTVKPLYKDGLGTPGVILIEEVSL